MIIRALMTNKNSPRLMMVIGNVNSTKTGLIKALTTAKTIATTTAVHQLLTCTPGKTYALTIMMAVEINH